MATKVTATTSTSEDTQSQDTPPAAVAPRPRLSPLTNAYSFNQAVQWLALVAQSATNLQDLQAYLAGVAEETATLVEAINTAEGKVVSRVTAGVPRIGGA